MTLRPDKGILVNDGRYLPNYIGLIDQAYHLHEEGKPVYLTDGRRYWSVFRPTHEQPCHDART